MTEETRQEIPAIRDDLNKLSACVDDRISRCINPLNAELNPIRHLLALVGARHIVHVSRIRVNSAKKQHDNLRKEMNNELNVAKQEIRTLMQEVKQK